MTPTSRPSTRSATNDGASGSRSTSIDDGGRRGRRRSLFRRGEDALAHAVYGLILTLATLGELVHHEVASGEAAAWLVGAGAVLLAAHLFSDELAHVAASGEGVDWRGILTVGREDLAVTAGAIAAASLMALAALAGLDTAASLIASIALGLAAVAGLSYLATSGHRPLIRLLMAGLAAAVGAAIVVLENAF